MKRKWIFVFIVISLLRPANMQADPDGGDCNGNGIPDEEELSADYVIRDTYPLEAPSEYFTAWGRNTIIVPADLDSDGDPELLTAISGTYNESASSTALFFNNGNGTFAPEVYIDTGSGPRDVATGDFDNDGDIDFATANNHSGDVSVLLNTGDGTFSDAVNYPVADPTLMVSSDIDGDGDVDLVVGRYTFITILVNSGSGEFTTREINSDIFNENFYSLAAGDVDNDGDIDIVAGDRYIYILKNPGDGYFTEVEDYNLAAGNPGICWPHGMACADVSGDGAPDIITADYTDGGTPSISVLLNEGNGTFRTPVPYYFHDTSGEATDLTVGDFNNDGRLDAGTVVHDRICLIFNNGNGTFSSPVYYSVTGSATNILAVDVDGDKDLDLAVKQGSSHVEMIILENTIRAADLNGNGILDECENGSVLIARNEEWNYFKGTEAPPPGWRELSFDDSSWESGEAPIGYGEDIVETAIDDMRENYLSLFFRKTFEVADPAEVNRLFMTIDYDDGFIAYLNGVTICGSNVNAGAGYNSPAAGNHESGAFEFFDVSGAAELLETGANALCVQVHNTSPASSDLVFDASLSCNLVEQQHLLAVSSSEVEDDSTADIYVELTSEDPVQAFSFGIAHDPDVAALEAIDFQGCPVLEGLYNGAGPELFEVNLNPNTTFCDPGIKAGAIVYCIVRLEAQTEEVIPPSEAGPIAHLVYRPAPEAADGMQTSLDITGCLGVTKPCDIVLTIDDSSLKPETESGGLTVVEPVDPPTQFRRGDTNQDGGRDISDAVRLLSYLFGLKGRDLDCKKAADANDDGSLNIADAVHLLTFLFASLETLPAPYETCGTDQTDDELTCDSFSPCSQRK